MALKTVALIPARLASTRFPQKMLQPLGSKTLIQTVFQAVQQTALFDDVCVVTDSDVIYEEIKNNGGKALMSSPHHQSGSDRIAEAAAAMDVDVVVNVQGDTPFITREPLQQLIREFEDASVQVASLMQKIEDAAQIQNPNVVKVCVNKKRDALYFSRSPIPYNRDGISDVHYYKHIGVYAFRKAALLQFTQWPVSALEACEKLEQLRYLENGINIRMVETAHHSIEVDTPEDMERARALMER